jgi:PBP1b-binding outer membrane lipoprotein LpoB
MLTIIRYLGEIVKTKIAAIILMSGLVLAGCSSPTTETPEPEEIERAIVPWEDYAPEVKIRLDEMMEAKDCSGLQAQFDISYANNDATMSRTGHNNADLMRYTDEAMQIAGCYE